jgi:hypothetical protein
MMVGWGPKSIARGLAVSPFKGLFFYLQFLATIRMASSIKHGRFATIVTSN